jgi:hypothetical protein
VRADNVQIATTFTFYTGLLLMGIIANPSALAALDEHTNSNYQGVSGLVQIPTAATIPEGYFEFSTTNLIDGIYKREYQIGAGDYQSGRSNHLLFSPLGNVEVSLRNVGVKFGDGNDLSANIKYRFDRFAQYGVDIAVGMTDVGGLGSYFDGYYGVVSKKYNNLTFTAGIGQYSPRNDTETSIASRYNNGFVGVEYRANEWLSVMLEHDGVDHAAAVSLRTPSAWFNNQLSLYSKLVITDDYSRANTNTVDVLVGIQGRFYSSTPPSTASKYTKKPGSDLTALINAGEKFTTQGSVAFKTTEMSHLSVISELRTRIAAQGFDSVWVGERGKDLVVTFENNVFNRNDIDALGVVLGLINGCALEAYDYEHVILGLNNLDTPVMNIKLTTAHLSDFYADMARLQFESLPLTPVFHRGDVRVGGVTHPYWRPQVSIAPKLRKFMATEIGMYDYSLALNTHIRVPLFQGTELSLDHDVPISESDDFAPGRAFYPFRIQSGVKSLLLRHTRHVDLFAKDIFISGAIGHYQDTFEQPYYVAFSESQSTLATNHNLSLRVGVASHRDASLTKRIATVKYRYYISQWNTDLSIEAGQYWNQDRGFTLSAQKHYGDTRLRVFYQNTDRHSVGVDITIPFTTHKDVTPSSWGQLKGADSWVYTGQTVVKSATQGGNNLSVQRAFVPVHLNHLTTTYFNDDRLHKDYLLANQNRLKMAYRKFVQ